MASLVGLVDLDLLVSLVNPDNLDLEVNQESLALVIFRLLNLDSLA